MNGDNCDDIYDNDGVDGRDKDCKESGDDDFAVELN